MGVNHIKTGGKVFQAEETTSAKVLSLVCSENRQKTMWLEHAGGFMMKVVRGMVAAYMGPLRDCSQSPFPLFH